MVQIWRGKEENTMTKSKRISKAGGVTIPADIRRDMGFDSGSAVDISVSRGSLIVAPHTPRCCFCDSTENVKVHMNKRVCAKCIKSMGELINE